ncbi:MAG: hypothetical protein K6B74_06200 [Ruminococcus sp.]|nr:hypothetical protein [Ruminococcus sp.]
MVPLIGYNFGSRNFSRMNDFSTLARNVIIGFSVFCSVLFWIFARQIVGAFIDNAETIRLGAEFLRGRCFALPFMMIGYHVVNYMNAVNKGKISFLLAIIRHLLLIIPIMLIMNIIWGLNGLVWSQLISDAANALVACLFMSKIGRSITGSAK